MALTSLQQKQLEEIQKTIKNESDSLKEALKRLRNYKGDMIPLSEILKMDNIVRAENGLPQLTKYPIQLKEYSPASKKSYWHVLIGAIIKKEVGRLPQVFEQYAEAPDMSPEANQEEIEIRVKAETERMLPGLKPTKEQISVIRDSIIAIMSNENAPDIKEEVKGKEEKKGDK